MRSAPGWRGMSWAFRGSLMSAVWRGEPGPRTCGQNDVRAGWAVRARGRLLFRLLESWGVKPDFLAGHRRVSSPRLMWLECFSTRLTPAVLVGCSRALDGIPAGGWGRWSSVQASEEEVVGELGGSPGRGHAGGRQWATAVVLSGDEQGVLPAWPHHMERAGAGDQAPEGSPTHFTLRAWTAMLDESRLVAQSVKILRAANPDRVEPHGRDGLGGGAVFGGLLGAPRTRARAFPGRAAPAAGRKA